MSEDDIDIQFSNENFFRGLNLENVRNAFVISLISLKEQQNCKRKLFLCPSQK